MSDHLQTRSLHVHAAYEEIVFIKHTFHEVRDDTEQHHESWFEEGVKVAAKMISFSKNALSSGCRFKSKCFIRKNQ